MWHFIETAEDLAARTGNCGRAVRRFMDFELPAGQTTFTIGGPDEELNLLEFALYLNHVRKLTELANEAFTLTRAKQGVAAEASHPFSIAAADLSLQTVFVRVTAPSVPGGVKAQQELLVALAFATRRLAMAGLFGHEQIREAYQALFASLLVESPRIEAQYVERFGAMVSDGVAYGAQIPGSLYSLASHLTAALDGRGAVCGVARLNSPADKAKGLVHAERA